MERAFAYLGERGQVLFQAGDPTADEQALDVKTAQDGDETVPEDDDEPLSWSDEETVLTLAGRWSIDPRDLEGAIVPGHPWIASTEATKPGSHSKSEDNFSA